VKKTGGDYQPDHSAAFPTTNQIVKAGIIVFDMIIVLAAFMICVAVFLSNVALPLRIAAFSLFAFVTRKLVKHLVTTGVFK
jgi:hypothetical protein